MKRKTAKGTALPEGWREVRLGEIATFFSGGTPSRSNSEYYKGNIPFIGSGDIKSDSVQQFITEQALKESSAKMVKRGDLLYALYGATSGEVAISQINGAINQAVLCIRSREDHRFLYNYFLMEKMKILNFYLQGGQGNLSAHIIKSLQIFLPPIPEQKAIASLLETWDTAIEKTEALIAAKEKWFKWLRHEFIANSMTHKNPQKISLDKMEEMNMVSLKRGKVISKKDITNHPGEYPIYSSSVKNNGLFGSYGKFMFDEELITWSVDGGGNFFYRGCHKFSVTNVCGYIRINTKKLDCYYLCSQLQLIHAKLVFDYQSKAHPSVIRKIYRCNIPPLSEQQSVTKILQAARCEIELLKKLIREYQNQKCGLMQKLLTGEWGLRTQ